MFGRGLSLRLLDLSIKIVRNFYNINSCLWIVGKPLPSLQRSMHKAENEMERTKKDVIFKLPASLATIFLCSCIYNEGMCLLDIWPTIPKVIFQNLSNQGLHFLFYKKHLSRQEKKINSIKNKLF